MPHRASPHPLAILALRRCRLCALACAVLALWAPAATAQPPSFEDIQRIKAEVAVPRWRDAANVSRLLHANPPDPATAEQWRSLDADTDPQIGKTPLERIAHAPEAQRNTNARWLRWRVLAENADARYSFAYAAQLIKMRDTQGDFEEEAILFQLHAKLALTLDGVRCTDPSKLNHLQRWYTSQEDARQLELKAASLTPAQRSGLVLEAIAIEDMRGERPAMGWLCPRREPEHATSTAEALPRFVPDAEWRSKRASLLDQLARDAMRNL
ncbi:hypothetical protein RD110_15050 [Rhodoferax koreense]|uniref:Uncharacterized protein n=1 Tax=Rhodoferax koreensis TaxID=1842727 RepID=A0A1P8JX66_9BURK|nr:hypothetical protein [Rhodoferax koreense]APW38346.1 hypothetical protein RD110_15050 [Rhodoferax koreense]